MAGFDSAELITMLRDRERLAMECASVARGAARAAREAYDGGDAEAGAAVLEALDAFLAGAVARAEELERARVSAIGAGV